MTVYSPVSDRGSKTRITLARLSDGSASTVGGACVGICECILLVLTNASLGFWPACCQATELPPPHAWLGILGSCSLPGVGSAWPPPASSGWVPGEKAAHHGGQTPELHSLSREHSYSPCAADREFTFIPVTGVI